MIIINNINFNILLYPYLIINLKVINIIKIGHACYDIL